MADYQKKTLKNGLRLITVPLKETQSVTVLISVRAGSRYESKKINGISHFLEHMLFKGTKKRATALEIASTIDAVGAEFNGHTGKEETGFYVKSASKHLPLALDILTDILTNSLFDQKEIEKEKGVIIEEINMRQDTPIAMVGELFEELLYGQTALGQRIIGLKENIRQIERKDFLSYLERFYQPNNLVVTIAGSQSKLTGELAKIESVLTKALVSSQRPLPVFKKLSFFQSRPRLKLQHKKTEQAHFCLGVRAFKRIHPDRYVLAVLATILGGNMSSRLFTEIREKRGLAYYVKTSTAGFQETGYLVTQAGVDVGKIEEAIKVILEEYGKLINHQPLSRRQSLWRRTAAINHELKKAKEFLKGRLILALEDSQDVAELYGETELLENKIRTPGEIIAGIDRVRPEDISRVANAIFLPRNLNLAIIGPYKDEEEFKRVLKM